MVRLAFEGAASSRAAASFLVVEGGPGLGKSRLIKEAEGEAFVAGLRSFRWEALRYREDEAHDGGPEAAPETGDDPAWFQSALLASPPASAGLGSFADEAERSAASTFDLLTREPSVLLVDDVDRLPFYERTVARLIVEKVRSWRQSPQRLRKGAYCPVLVYTFTSRALRRDEFSTWWARLADLSWTTVFSLAPWSAEEVSLFLDRVLPPRRRLEELEALLVRESLGQPGRLRLLLQDLARAGELRLESGVWVAERSTSGLRPLPGDGRRFREEWDQLNRQLEDVLGVCAVGGDGGRPIATTVVASALELPPDRLARNLRRLESLELLCPARITAKRAGDSVLLGRRQRLWVLRAGGRARRRDWRRLVVDSSAPRVERVFQELRLGPVPAERVSSAATDSGVIARRLLAFHVDRSRQPAVERAASAFRLGEIHHRRGDARRARPYLLFARKWIGDAAVRARIEMFLGEEALLERRLEEAGELLEEAEKALSPTDEALPRVLCDLAFREHLSGETLNASESVACALRRCPGHPALENLRAVTAIALGDLDQAETRLRSVLARRDLHLIPGNRGTLYSTYGVALRRQGRLDEAVRTHRRAAEDFERAGLVSRAARAYGNLGVALRVAGKYEEALASTSRCAALHRELGNEEGTAVGEANLGSLARELGLLGTASRRFHAAEHSARAAGREARSRVLDHPAFLENRILLALELGEEKKLRDLLARREEALSRPGEPLRAETSLVELRLWRTGRKPCGSDLVRLCRREFRVSDGPFLYELALLRPDDSPRATAGEEREIAELVDRARDELRRLARVSPRERFYSSLVDLAVPENEARTREALDQVMAQVHTFPLRDARRAGLRAMVERAGDPETREKARGELRRLLDEILFDLDSVQRKTYRERPDIREALELTRSASRGSASKRERGVREAFRFNQEILKEKRLDGLVEKIVDAAMSLTDAERGVLVMRQGGCLRVVAARSGGRDLVSPDDEISHTVLEKSLEEGVACVTTDALADTTLRSVSSVAELGLRSILVVPLRAKRSRILGALYLDNPFEKAVFDSDDLELAESFCAQAALAWTAAERRRETALHLWQLRRSNRRLKNELRLSRRDLARLSRRAHRQLDDMVGDSRTMREVFHLVEMIAPTDLPVLITGESGTGKELVARAIHRLSPRSARAFVAENCGAIPATLLESALFGYTKGAFTGADRDRPGIFAIAEGGTLFLDEIGELAPDLQSRLLRVLQERELRPLGARRALKVDVRLVASTNRDISQAIAVGDFREDLYYRIQGAEIHVPPLRERLEDVPLLVQHFLRALAHGAREKQVGAETMDQLCRYPWPGNVRELENELRRAFVLCSDHVIGLRHLSPSVRDWTPAREGRETDHEEVRPVRELVQDAIRRAMRRFDGRKQDVARALGISRTTLYLKLKEMEETRRDDPAEGPLS